MDTAGVLFLYNSDFAQIPVHIPHSHVPQRKLISQPSSPKGGLNGLRVTPFSLPVFDSDTGMRPTFAQGKKSAVVSVRSSLLSKRVTERCGSPVHYASESCHFWMCCLELLQ